MFLANRAKMSNLYKGPTIDASYQFRFIWQSSFREDFLEINQSERKNSCGGHVFNASGRYIEDLT
jgi:hypothetical protein